jgi:hypothetical protein
MAKLIFEVLWHAEPAAGLRGGSEKVVIHFQDTSQELIDADMVEYFRGALREWYDTRGVYTAEEMRERTKREQALWEHLENE